MIDEMICAFDSPGSMSAALIFALLFNDPTHGASGQPAATKQRKVSCADLLRSRALRTGWLRSPFRRDGCRSLNLSDASAVPMTGRKKIDQRSISECECVLDDTVCPVSGMYARMWAQPEHPYPQLQPSTSQRHEMQSRGEVACPSMIGTRIAFEES